METIDHTKTIKELAENLNNAIEKFNLVSTPEEQDALWHEIEGIKREIDLLIKQAGEGTPA